MEIIHHAKSQPNNSQLIVYADVDPMYIATIQIARNGNLLSFMRKGFHPIKQGENPILLR